MIDETGAVRHQGFTLPEMTSALEQAGSRFVTLLRGIDSNEGTRPIPQMTWNIAETAVHMLTIVRRGLGDRRRADTLQQFAELNDRAVKEIDERNLAAIAELIESDMAEYMKMLRNVPQEEAGFRVSQLHVGLRADLPTGLSYQLCDFIAHGWDIATAVGLPWNIDSHEATLDLRAMLPALRPWVRTDVIDGASRTISFTCGAAGPSLRASAGNGSYDVNMLAQRDDAPQIDPAEMFLAVTGRVASENPIISEFASWFVPL